MSEEQNLNQTEDKKNCKCKLIIAAVILSLILSTASFVLSTLAYTGATAGSGENHKQVVISKQYDKGRSLAKAKETGKPIIVFFYTDWCGFCQRFAPTFDKITKVKDIKKNFAIAFVNCEKEENQALMHEYNVQGFPTVFVIDKNGNKTQLDNSTFFNDDAKKVVSKKALELINDEEDDD